MVTNFLNPLLNAFCHHLKISHLNSSIRSKNTAYHNRQTSPYPLGFGEVLNIVRVGLIERQNLINFGILRLLIICTLQ